MNIAICAGKEDFRLLTRRLDSLRAEAFIRREDLLYAMKARPYDVVIVALPGAIGMETALGARKFAPKAALFWASDESAFIAESYRLRAAMFLTLPLEEEQVQELVMRVKALLFRKAPPEELRRLRDSPLR